ncbi:type 2 isopentenyl-diphosphate Delta-isomerase [Bifidobacterium mongoliense]|uniref:type 2 isopentenyl-diphosphate Delta-isomerase n=1 Tax=Bifidobacterium mongoliense TaxID=518643 RepID=UPI00264A0A42|nr:type 2 isopentenyl-diphosphate Delta-isomerase [Bifidobacterium mongoliense]MDN5979850.1 type 2 isopentenyl-diphosphate Delta-isomerase [Bifidobacterium mongoliense]
MMGAEEHGYPSSEAQASGKLYIAGEYAVVESGHPAILVAVNRFVTVRVSPAASADGHGSIRSEGHPEADATWHRSPDGVCVVDEPRPGAAFILESIRAVDEVVRHAGIAVRVFDIAIVSELDDDSGRKYGLGSSAAVTVASVKALLGFYDLDLEPTMQYKLAFIASSRAQKVGSGGDIAASLFGGCIRFCAVDRAWVKQRLSDTKVSALIAMPWPGLGITRLRVFGDRSHGGPAGVAPAPSLLVGWTGRPASTEDLVTHVHRHNAEDHHERYQRFLDASDRCVDELATALTHADMDGIRRHIGQARDLLAGLSGLTGTLIETPELTALIDIALEHDAAAKTSGAGGGDCGIAITNDALRAADIRREWAAQGIVPLELTVGQPLADAPEWHDASSLRKDDHVRLALRQHEHEGANAFDDLRFIHHALHGVSVSQVDTSVRVCGGQWMQPFYINAMTGGSARTGEINRALAHVAGETGVAMASGSQHAALRDPALTPTFTVIREQTTGFVFANIGPTVSPDQAVEAVRMLHADALQIHINLAQEIIMPEGDRDFSTWPDRIRAIAQAVDVPVVVKEVGFGMSRATVRELAVLGITTVDVSGRGGTDFGVIENARRSQGDFSALGQWGQSTALCLLESLQGPDPVGIDVLASGGVRNPLDVVKALALGARAVGVSGHFLGVLDREGERGLAAEIGRWAAEIRSIMALLGARTVGELGDTDLFVDGLTARHADLLGVDVRSLAHRSENSENSENGGNVKKAAQE